MNLLTSQPEAPATDADLAQRCQELGITLLGVDLDGVILQRPEAREAPLQRAVIDSPLLAEALGRCAAEWFEQTTPEATPLWPGCWVLPVPMERRRRRVGYHVAVLLTPELAESEQFHQLCDAAQLDREAAARRLRRDHTADRREVHRTARMLNWMADDLGQLRRRQDELDNLSQQLGESYEELSLVYQLSAHMTVTRDPRAFLEEACAELHQVVGVAWIALQLTDDDVRLQNLRGNLITSGRAPCAHDTLGGIGGRLMQRFGGGEPTIVDDASSLEIDGLEELADQLLIVPLVHEGKPLGVLFGADKRGDGFSSVDSKLVNSAAQNMSIFLANAMLYEDMQDMFMGTLRSLIASIDAKDTYTCGHSERVAWLSRQLAEAAGLEPHTVERVYLSGLIHDVGKIGVPEAVLCKPGKLTDEEFAMIKAHPEIGVRILKDIRQMQDLLPGVLHHHERYDGGGYPYGLSGGDIPLFGRLICLADSFDAMSSSRTYRQAMPLEKVLEEVERCAGTQFDPELARVFLTLDFAPFQRMVEEHQRRLSPLDEVMGVHE